VPLAVVDTSVLVPQWSRLVIQRLAALPDAPFVPVWSEWIIAETWRVLTWRWIVRSGRTTADESRKLTGAANEMLRYLLPVFRLVSLQAYAGPDPWPELTDRDDAPLWQTAQIARARYVVSHNIADFPPLVGGRHVYGGVEYLTTVEFVEDVLDRGITELLDLALPVAAALRSGRTRG
jgi:hypothetical protein